MGEKNDRNVASDEVEDDNEGRNKEKAKKKSSEKTTESDGDEIDAAETSTVCRKLQTKKSEKVTFNHRRKGNKPTKRKRSSSSVGEDYYDDLVEMTAKPAYNKTRRVTRSTTRSAARIIATKRRKITSPQQMLPVVEETETNNSPDDAEKETKKSKCEICGCETVDQRNLLQHVQRAHHERNHRCETCGRRYALLKDLTIHRKTHNERYVCNTCGRVYKQESVLKKHMLTHTADFVKPVFKCTECERTFSTRYTLTTHTAAVHRGEATSFLCPTCGKSFTQKHTLVEHQNVHLGVKPFTCDVCDMRFTFSSSLRQHRMKHDAVKRYKCVECGKDFTHRNSLRLHKVIHQKERPFQCQFCGRSFTQKQALQRHERIHRGERPFICEVCGRSFTDNSTLRRHINTHSKTPATTTTTPANSTSVKITGNTSTQIPQTSQPLINHLSPLSLPASAATALPTEHPQSPQVNNRLSPISSSRQQSTLTMLPSVTMPSSSIDIHQMQLAPPHQHPLHHHHSHHHHQQQQHLHPQQHHLQHPQHQQLPQPPPTIHQQMLHPGQQYSIAAAAAAVPPISNSVYHTGLYDDSVMIPMSMMTNEDTIPMHY
ncbi:uncharacterized protein LOC141906973 [Tubulanus polymorphus]|uniref:uncharacterized protein LOC141906973 n=1 Tax=Tubulanus polymorphus TaxID=672921 RepID=UPI003DA3C267